MNASTSPAPLATPDTNTDHFSGHAAEYARRRPSYPEALFDWLALQCKAHQQAWDCGTGNGQAATQLATRFAAVLATDLSSEQLAHAPRHERITYRAQPAESSGLAAQSCDLITVAQALHWFCHDDFYHEAKRVLKPGGLIAAWTYRLLESEPAINALVSHLHDAVVGPWWPPERHWVDVGYAGMPFPFDTVEAPPFAIELEWSLDDLLAYLRTWSATQRYLAETGRDPVSALADEFAAAWGDANAIKRIRWPIAIRCGRTPA